MLTERPLHPDVETMLLNGEPFNYAHLIKFERPSRPDSSTGEVSTAKHMYTYLTDASINVKYDDGSTSLAGVPNGTQTYVANKVIKVSPVQEDVEVKASTYSLTLDGNGLGAIISEQVTSTVVDSETWDLTFPAKAELINYGFREGDKVTLTGAHSGSYSIFRFRAQNVVRVKKIEDTLAVATGLTTMSLSSDEIISILADKNSAQYASFLNREVFIYRTYFQEGSMVGEPFLLFKGIVSGVSFEESDTAVTVSWSLTSHWGDFSEVKGRITSDDSHRALDQNGLPQPQSALKVEYAYDKGFAHSETSLHIMAKYVVMVEKQKIKTKSGFLGTGIGGKVKVKTYLDPEDRFTELDFQLQAKSIPVIYGVRMTEGIPVFADTLNDDTSTVYIAQVISEGEIGGIYDVYIDGNSLICNNKADFDTRSTQTDQDTVELICRGRADRGDVLGGQNSYSIESDAESVMAKLDLLVSRVPGAASLWKQQKYDASEPFIHTYEYIRPVVATADTEGAGVNHGESIHLNSPQDITIDLFSGQSGQIASPALVEVAKNKNFKIQNDYWEATGTESYWSPNHRLLDTAYVVVKVKIAEGETTVPELKFVVKGKAVECYNYDKSYAHHVRAPTGESASNFKLGDYVALEQLDGTPIASSVQIIDKWTFYDTAGKPCPRFRFSVDPDLGYVNEIPAITEFRMKKGSNTWTMMTFNHVELSGNPAMQWLTPITSVSNDAGFLRINFTGGTSWNVGGDPAEGSSLFSVVDVDGYAVDIPVFSTGILSGEVGTNYVSTRISWDAVASVVGQLTGKYIVRRNVISLPSSASATNGYYNGSFITVTRIDPTTGKRTQQKHKIIDYNGATRIASIDGLWNYGYHPKQTDTLQITVADRRVSINPAMQLMDYICSRTYGRGLDPFKDLNFESWLETGRRCDVRSDVTVECASTPSFSDTGGVYRYPASGDILWQGRVSKTNGKFVTFTSVLGKLTNAWNSWRTFKVGELVYRGDKIYVVTAETTFPTEGSLVTSGKATLVTSLALSKVSGTGPTTLPLVVDGNPVRDLKNGSIVPGYSLYDCDGVDYWRYLGWDQFDQRYVTKHQTNLIVDTSLSMFENVNSFLEHFGGIMRYSSGQYYLETEEPAPLIANSPDEPRNITEDHIIGKIRLTDEGIRSAYNSLTASFADPANKYEARNISFFNSNYLKADKNVAKKGNLTVPGITNYYNTRLLADKILNKSRYGLQISFNMIPRGALLLAGQVIQLQYPRYGWVDKKFRITTLTHQDDATVDIVAEEYDDSFYGLSNVTKQEASGLAGNYGSVSVVAPPTGLVATNVASGTEDYFGIKLAWENNPVLQDNQNAYTEVYSSYSDQLYIEVTSVVGNTFTTTLPHGLKNLEAITVIESNNVEIPRGKIYYLRSVTDDTFQLSSTKGGAVAGFTDDTDGMSVIFNTSLLIATLPLPVNNYTDMVPGVADRVKKYYWVRHKIIK